MPFTPEFRVIKGIMDNSRAKIKTLDEVISERSTNVDFCTTLTSGGRPNTLFNVDTDGMAAQVSSLKGASHRVVPTSMYPRFLHLCHYSLLVSHPVELRKYHSMRKESYWLHIANEVLATVRDCCFYTHNRTVGKRQRQPKPFSPKGTVKYIVMNIFGQLLKTKQRNQFAVLMTERYNMLTKAIPASKTNATIIARKFVENWVANFVISYKVVTENGPRFLSKFFVAVPRNFAVNK